MKKYLVTGGAGFIGSHIAEAILRNGDSVRVLDNFSTGKKENIQSFMDHPNFELIEGDMTDFETAQKAVRGIEIVLHQAALPSVPRSITDPLKSNEANVTGTLVMLLASRDEGVKKFVYASSSSVYGDNPELPKREDFPVRPISPYALQKYAGERYCQIFWQLYQLPTVCLRYFNVFGPRQDLASQYAAVIPNFIKAALHNEKPVIFGDGNQSRDFTFVDNIVRANVLAAQSGDGFGEVFNIACNKEVSLNHLLELIGEIVGSSVQAEYREGREGDVQHSRADIAKASNMFQYAPAVEVKEGLEKTIEWYRQLGS